MIKTNNNNFGKAEKLSSHIQIDYLFRNGKKYNYGCLRVFYLLMPGKNAPPVTVGVTAPKKQFKKAVHRNRLKRLLREAYRLQKQPLTTLCSISEQQMQIFFIFTGRQLLPFTVVSADMAQCLKYLQKQLPQAHATDL